MRLRLTFIGPPGSGKGTQAKLLRPLGFLQVSSGDMLRADIAAGTARGKAIAATVAAGGLVEDEVLLEVVGELVRRHERDSLVFDGYPRTLAQARQAASLGLDAAVFFEVSDAVLRRRLGDRVMGPDGTIYDLQLYPPPSGLPVTRRADDDPEVQKKRLATYRADEAGLRGFYAAAGLAHAIHADLPMEQVHAEVTALVAKLGRPLAPVG